MTCLVVSPDCSFYPGAFHMAMAEAMPIYREVAAKQATAIVELDQRLSR